MIKKRIFTLMVCILVLALLFAGCIEGSFKKTETVVTKLDSNENVQWTAVIENNGYASARSLAPLSSRFIQTSDKGFFIAGIFSNSSAGDSLRTLKIDRAGNVVWDKRIPVPGGELFALHQRDDDGYLVFWNDGSVYNFNATGDLEQIVTIPEQIHRIQGDAYSAISLRSISPGTGGNLTAILTGGDYYSVQNPVLVAGLSQNGAVLWEKSHELNNPAGATSIIQTRDGGFLLGKFFFDDKQGGGKTILVEKTGPDSSIAWDTTLGICTSTFCNNDLLGMHESAGQGYELIYQSHEQNGNHPATIVNARLDPDGQVVQQELLTGIPGLPAWFLQQDGRALEIVSLVPERVQKFLIPENSGDNPPTVTIHYILDTDDGGYALLATRYYW